MRFACVVVAALTLCSCGREAPRIRGDTAGVPLTFVVTFNEEAMPVLAAKTGGFVRQIVIERDSWGDPWCSPWGFHHPPMFAPNPWYGDYSYHPSTRAYLLIGNGPAQAQYLRLRLYDPVQEVVVPVAPGKTITLSVQSYGGWEGWCEIGSLTVDAANKRFAVTLDRDGAQVVPSPLATN